MRAGDRLSRSAEGGGTYDITGGSCRGRVVVFFPSPRTSALPLKSSVCCRSKGNMERAMDEDHGPYEAENDETVICGQAER